LNFDGLSKERPVVPVGKDRSNYCNRDGRERRAVDKEEVMLVLSRKRSDSVLIGGGIRITVVKIERNQVRLGIEAPGNVEILREELVFDGPCGVIDEEPEYLNRPLSTCGQS
jgi:carbon storage regulator